MLENAAMDERSVALERHDVGGGRHWDDMSVWATSAEPMDSSSGPPSS